MRGSGGQVGVAKATENPKMGVIRGGAVEEFVGGAVV